MRQLTINQHSVKKVPSTLADKNTIETKKGFNNVTYTNMFKCAPYAMAMREVDSDKIVDANNLCTEIFGYELEELIGQSRFIIKREKSLDENEDNLSQLLQGEIDSYSSVIQYYKKEGTPVWVKTTRTLVQDGAKTYVMSSFLDLTEEFASKRSLRKSEEQYRKLFENSLSSIALYDFEIKRFTDCNNTFTEIYGYTIKELTQMSVVDLAWNPPNEEDPIYQQRYEENLVRLRKNESIRFESIHKSKQGEKLIVDIILIPFYVEDKLYVKQVTTNITERKLAKERLNQKVEELNTTNQKLKKYIESNLQLENFAYVTSHDLREPIRTIIGFSQILDRKIGNDLAPEDKESLDFIINASKNLHTLVKDILAFSKVNGQNAKFEQLKTKDIIYSVLADLRAITNSGEVDIALTENLPETINGHRSHLYQLFQNLIKNAAKFRKNDQKALIQLHYKDLGDAHQFSIEDNGIGIKEQYFESIFLMFKKLNGKNEFSGSGIGLAISKKVVEMHQGEIWVESEVDQGTTFHFTVKKDLLKEKEETD